MSKRTEIVTCKKCGKQFKDYICHKRMYCSKACIMYGPKKYDSHGTYSRLYEIWCHVKSRCLTPTVFVYSYYGGRGITICDEWRDSYVAFRDWALANGYSDTLELDRISVNGNYEPSNCRWANRHQQMANTRKRCDGLTSKYKGVSFHKQNECYRVQLMIGGRNRYIAVFKTALEAALFYDDMAFYLRGEYAYVNYPERIRHKDKTGIESDRMAAGGSAAKGMLRVMRYATGEPLLSVNNFQEVSHFSTFSQCQ